MKKVDKDNILNKEMTFQKLDDYMTFLKYYPALDEEIEIAKDKNMIYYIHSENLTEVYIYFVITENNKDKRNFKLKILFIDDSMEWKMLSREDIYTLSNTILDKVAEVREARKIIRNDKESKKAIDNYLAKILTLQDKVTSLLEEDE